MLQSQLHFVNIAAFSQLLDYILLRHSLEIVRKCLRFDHSLKHCKSSARSSNLKITCTLTSKIASTIGGETGATIAPTLAHTHDSDMASPLY